MICALGETTGPPALQFMRRKMMADPVGRQILEYVLLEIDIRSICSLLLSQIHLKNNNPFTFRKV